MAGFIERERWKSFLDEFTKRNQFRATRLEVVGEIGAQEEEEYLPLVGVSFEPKGSAAGSVGIVLGGESTKDERHIEHLIPRPRCGKGAGLVYLVATTLRVHPSFKHSRLHFALMEISLFDINEDWCSGLRVMRRRRMN